jgi:hypothetical protein
MLGALTAVAFTGSAFAQDAAPPSNKADCGMWNAESNTCADKE